MMARRGAHQVSCDNDSGNADLPRVLRSNAMPLRAVTPKVAILAYIRFSCACQANYPNRAMFDGTTAGAAATSRAKRSTAFRLHLLQHATPMTLKRLHALRLGAISGRQTRTTAWRGIARASEQQRQRSPSRFSQKCCYLPRIASSTLKQLRDIRLNPRSPSELLATVGGAGSRKAAADDGSTHSATEESLVLAPISQVLYCNASWPSSETRSGH